MGRASSTGHPFLVQRNDAGQFTYHRDVPAALAPLVTGEVKLLWSGRIRVLKGKATIKISLGTETWSGPLAPDRIRPLI